MAAAVLPQYILVCSVMLYVNPGVWLPTPDWLLLRQCGHMPRPFLEARRSRVERHLLRLRVPCGCCVELALFVTDCIVKVNLDWLICQWWISIESSVLFRKPDHLTQSTRQTYLSHIRDIWLHFCTVRGRDHTSSMCIYSLWFKLFQQWDSPNSLCTAPVVDKFVLFQSCICVLSALLLYFDQRWTDKPTDRPWVKPKPPHIADNIIWHRHIKCTSCWRSCHIHNLRRVLSSCRLLSVCCQEGFKSCPCAFCPPASISTSWPLPSPAPQWQHIAVSAVHPLFTLPSSEGNPSGARSEAYEHVNTQRGREGGIRFKRKGWERQGLGDDVPSHLCIIYMCIHHVTVVVTQRGTTEGILQSDT